MTVPRHKASLAPRDLLLDHPLGRMPVQALCPQAFVTAFVAGVCS